MSANSVVLDNPSIISKFLDYVFHEMEVLHLEWEGKTWYSWDTFFYTRPTDLEEREWDPDYSCYGEMCHKWEDDDDDEEDEEDEEKIIPLPCKIHQVKKIEDFRHIFSEDHSFMCKKTVTLPRTMYISNPYRRINKDHRGSNHIAIDIDTLYTGEVELYPGTYTLLEIANIIWRVKGNKWDNNYEE